MGWLDRQSEKARSDYQAQLALRRVEWKKMGIIWEWEERAGLTRQHLSTLRLFPDHLEVLEAKWLGDFKPPVVLAVDQITTVEANLGFGSEVTIYGLGAFKWSKLMSPLDARQLCTELAALRPDLDIEV